MAEGEGAPTAPLAPARNVDGFSIQAIHLVRTALQTNLTLSQMADQKASILMGATFVVFTISVGQASRDHFPAPLMVLALFACVSALLAASAIIPRVTVRADPGPASNLLFFGAFTKLSEEEFTSRILHELQSDERVFRAMLRDLYQNGQVLQHRKYRLLRLAYIAFLIGLALTMLTMAIEYRAQIAAQF